MYVDDMMIGENDKLPVIPSHRSIVWKDVVIGVLSAPNFGTRLLSIMD